MRLSGPTPFAAGCDGQPPAGTLNRNAEVQPDLAVDPGNPRHLVGAWQQDRWSGVGAPGLVTVTSFDGGKRWTRATPPVSVCTGGDYWRATDSVVSIGPDGTAYLVELAMNATTPQGDHALLVTRSRDGGLYWDRPATLVREGTDPDQFVWNDIPSITADPTDGRFVYTVWDRIVDPPLGGPLYLARSVDHGRTWQAPHPVYDPGAGNVVVAAKVAVRPDGSLVALFGVARYDLDTEEQLGFSVQSIRSTDHGATWSAPSKLGDVTYTGTKDPATGTVFRDGSGAIAVLAASPDGTVHAAWQDSRFSTGAHDSIAYVKSSDGGRTWSAPKRANTDPGEQAFSPAIAVDDHGTVGITYSALRPGFTAENRIARSTDGGGTFHSSPLAATFSLADAPVVSSGAHYLGEYHGMVGAGRTFLTLYPAPTGDPANPTDIYLSRF
jgi:hypothetical protein